MAAQTNPNLQKQLESLLTKISTCEVREHQPRNIQAHLDLHANRFRNIHRFFKMALATNCLTEANAIFAKGIVDIFQLEIGAIFELNWAEKKAKLLGHCNLELAGELIINLPEDWPKAKELQICRNHEALYEIPVPKNSPWQALNLASAIYMPLFTLDGEFSALAIGGITTKNTLFYTFDPQEILASFMVYCQLMNGIYNNIYSLAKAYSAGHAKSQFLASLSHEIRTPMNAILGLIQISRKSEDLAQLKRAMRLIDISSRHLLNLINDVLDISKIEEGKLVLQQESFNLLDIVENLLGNAREKAKEKQQKLLVSYKNLRSENFISDPTRLSQVLINLLSNAIKFTADYGTVSLEIEEKENKGSKILLKFTVSDTGIGMSEEFLAKVFLPFEQEDNTIAPKYSGTGLGLAISSRIVELLGGEIQVTSKLGQGSTFTFELWLETSTQENFQLPGTTATDQAIYDFKGQRILVVDDIEINREIIFAMLAETGAELEQAANGKEALEKFISSAANYYDLILMDIQMPVMDGYTATKEIRALSRPDAQKVKILAMTADVFKDDIEKSLKAGMNGHIGKPVVQQVLSDTLAKELS